MPPGVAALGGGRIRLTLILGLAILAVAIYGGGQAAFHYWTYWNLREEAERAAIEVAAREGQEALGRQMVQAKAREYNLYLEDKDIQITAQGGVVTVSFAWRASIQFPGGYSYPLSFRVSASTSRRR